MKDSGDDQATLLHRLVQETTGDRFLLSELKGVWERCKYNYKMAHAKDDYLRGIGEAKEEAANAPPPLVFEPDVVKPYCDYMDERILERMEDCFERFTNIFEKFLPEAETGSLANDFEQRLPFHYKTLMSCNGYSSRLENLEMSDAKSGHALMLRLRFSLDVFCNLF